MDAYPLLLFVLKLMNSMEAEREQQQSFANTTGGQAEPPPHVPSPGSTWNRPCWHASEG